MLIFGTKPNDQMMCCFFVKGDVSFVVKKYSFVGLYGVRFFWEDGHSDGIYTFDFIDSLCNEKK